jgi:uncharacterized phage protein gp47/JayE
MGYQAPTIVAAGLVIPSYADILADLVTNFLSIYGQTVYLGTDSADYQLLSIVALKINDCMQAVQLAYNARSVSTAVGSDLDAILKMNNIQRKAASFSTAPGTVTGVAGTTINGGSAVDKQGFSWSLPNVVIIPSSGSVIVTLTCETAGAITAAPGTISQIASGGTQGWTGISNPSAASPGLPVEVDSQARGRQGVAVALPSQTRLEGTIAAIAELPGVTRSIVHENFTSATDGDGVPGHAIAAVVEGGDPVAIASAILANRGIGPNMFGSTETPITRPNGSVINVGWSRPGYTQIFVTMIIHGLAGYNTAVLANIAAALNTYLNSLQIGESVSVSALSFIASQTMPNILLPQFTITELFVGTAPDPTGTADIVVNWNNVAQTNPTQISVTEA